MAPVLSPQDTLAAQQVFRFLHRAGGEADLHFVTGKYGCKKNMLLDFEGGSIFESDGGKLKLKGGAFAVAAAAAAAGRVTRKVGRRKSAQHLLTKQGFPTKEAPAARLQRRIEGLLMTAGDGVLQSKAVLRALALKRTHALNRWFPRVGLRISPNGDLWVDSFRLFQFRLYRALAACCFIMDRGGKVSMEELMEHLYRPPELLQDEEYELTEEGRAASYEAGLAPSPEVEDWRLEARDRHWKGSKEQLPALPPPQETFDFGEDTELMEEALYIEEDVNRVALSTEAVKFEVVLAEKQVEPPLWLEAWIREYFVVEDDAVFLPFLAPWRPPPVKDPDAPSKTPNHWPIIEQEALLMNVQEESYVYGMGVYTCNAWGLSFRAPVDLG
ncbi:unnamed protein product [Effrenium voratum]|nr:unnamed protein product [Effrenium voratum]